MGHHDIDADALEVWFIDGEGVAEIFHPERLIEAENGITFTCNDHFVCIPYHVINRLIIGGDVETETV